MTTTEETMAQTAEATTSRTTQKSIQLTETAAGEVQKLITEEGRPEIALRIAATQVGSTFIAMRLRVLEFLDATVETPRTYASHTTWTNARSARRRGSRSHSGK